MLKDLIKNRNIDRYILASLMLFPLFTVSKIPVLIYILITYVLIFKRASLIKNFNQKKLNLFLFITLWVVFSIVTFFYSEDTSRFNKVVLRELPFIIVPFFIMFGFDSISKGSLNFIFKILIIAILIKIGIVFVGIVNGTNHFLNEKVSVFNIIENFKRFYEYTPNQLIGNYRWQPDRPILFFHKAYMSILMLISIVYLLFKINKIVNPLKKITTFLLLLFFNVALFFLFSFPNIIILVIVYLYFGLILIKKQPKTAIAIITTIVLAFGLYYTSSTGEKYINIQKKKFDTYIKGIANQIENPNKTIINNGRIRTATCAINNILKKPVFGYGAGDVKQTLTRCYKHKGFLTQFKERHNTHNYYLDRLLSGGLIMLILFLLMLITHIKLAIKSKDKIYAFVIVIFSLNLFFENVFSLAYGVFIFTIVTSILLKYNISNDFYMKSK